MQISIILINYNSTLFTIDAVNSMMKVIGDALTFEMIIVDNHSNEDEFLLLKKFIDHQPEEKVCLVASNQNLGFSGGNMLGTTKAQGDFLVFVNNDTLFVENSFLTLFNFMKANPSVAVSTCLSKNKEDINFACFDHFIGIRKLVFGRWILENVFNKPKRKETHLKSVSVDAVQGCLMFFDAKKFYEIGGFDTQLFLFYEEIDICKRATLNGYASVFCPDSYFYHFQGASTKNSISKKAEILISFLYVLKKNFGNTRYYFTLYYLFIKYFFKSIFSAKNILFLKIIIAKDPFKYSLRNKQ